VGDIVLFQITPLIILAWQLFSVFTFRHLLKKWVWIPFLWAAIIGYAQVYVGIHYPLDVICGTLLGLLFGFLTGSFFNKRFGFATFDNQPVG
jgi:undecaprenyl-diphosphatase